MAFDFERVIVFWINRVGFLTRAEIQRRFAKAGHKVTPEEWAVLMQLWHRDEQTPGELADNTIRDRTTITRLLDGMVRKGFVSRETDQADRRKVRVRLKPKGREMEDRLVPIANGLIADALKDVSDQDVAVALRTLRKMRDNLAYDGKDQ